MNNISNEASNRNVIIEGEAVPVRYCNMSWVEAYNSFNSKDEIKFTSFKKYVDKIYKKPHRKTDLCGYCQNAKQLKRELKIFASEFQYFDNNEESCISATRNENFKIINDINCKRLLEHFLKLDDIRLIKNDIRTELFNNIKKKLQDYQEVQFHRCISIGQRKIFNNQRNDIVLLEDSLLITVDFKQKIVSYFK